MADQNALLRDFCGLTGATVQEALRFLGANRWDLSSAATEYYTSQEELGAAAETEAEPQMLDDYTGPRTLDGRPAPESARPASKKKSKAPPKKGGIQTLGSLGSGSGGHAGHSHAHDDEDDDDDSDFEPPEQPRDLFAGGEKSGLAVQDPSNANDPRKIVNDLIKKAQKGAPQPGRAEPSAPSRFTGTGMTLGGDDTPSQAIPDPRAAAPQRREPVSRVLHFWTDGFSVEDGPLHRFDDPQNANDLSLIRSGRAPIHLMNVTRDQEVEVQLDRHDEPYKPQPKRWSPFGGGGQRLGSPTPGVASSSTASSRVPVPAPASAATTSSAENQVDETQPTLSLRIQLANGQRLPARFNVTQTIGDVYGFIERAYPGSNERSWVLATTFPNKEHTDKSAVLGELPEFKRGGTAVQKWV